MDLAAQAKGDSEHIVETDAGRNSSKSGIELCELLAPLTARTFIEDYWERKPLYIKGSPQKFQGLFDLPRFYEAIKRGCELPNPGGFLLSVAVKEKEDSLTFSESISPEQVVEALAQGFTICVNDISAGDNELTYFATAIREQLSYPGTARFNSYLSPDGSCTDTHLDVTVSTTLQIEGRKRWRFSAKPVIDWPISNAQLRRDGSAYWMFPWADGTDWAQLGKTDEADFIEVVLEPGDLLCLPAGTWHNTKAIGSSLALNLAFEPMNFFAFLVTVLEPTFIAQTAWRAGPPPVCPENVASKGLPKEIAHYLRQRLSELRVFVEDLERNVDNMDAVWRGLVGRDIPGPPINQETTKGDLS